MPAVVDNRRSKSVIAAITPAKYVRISLISVGPLSLFIELVPFWVPSEFRFLNCLWTIAEFFGMSVALSTAVSVPSSR